MKLILVMVLGFVSIGLLFRMPDTRARWLLFLLVVPIVIYVTIK